VCLAAIALPVGAEGDEPAIAEASAGGDEPIAAEASAEGDEPAAAAARAEGDEPIATEASTEGDEPIATEASAEGDEPPEASAVVSVAVPANFNFTLDPYEIGGRGQVYSDDFEFVNYGDTDVTLVITDAEVLFTGQGEFAAVPDEVGADFAAAPAEKTIQLILNTEDQQLILTDAAAQPLEISIAAGAPVTVSISGSLNPYPAEEWQDGDIKIQVSYSITAAPIATEPEKKQEPITEELLAADAVIEEESDESSGESEPTPAPEPSAEPADESNATPDATEPADESSETPDATEPNDDPNATPEATEPIDDISPGTDTDIEPSTEQPSEPPETVEPETDGSEDGEPENIEPQDGGADEQNPITEGDADNE
jgi:hypothetical protein